MRGRVEELGCFVIRRGGSARKLGGSKKQRIVAGRDCNYPDRLISTKVRPRRGRSQNPERVV